MLTQDMEDLIGLLEKNEVQYTIVGGFAVNFYGYVRSTQGLDLLILPSNDNAQRVVKALDEFGFGSTGISASYFERRGSAIHLGVEPNRIDLITTLKDMDLRSVFERSRKIEINKAPMRIISLEDLIESKKRSDRLKDLADAEELERIRQQDA